ncbi:PLP-dependent aminotransferase family protein [Catellatospora sp. KI3]|uniref:aminotransferase-like domain-containing protein n=1 Tax=Catellatospora sp. KI3 TaxID=3041620 RepID=UPI0024832624|nr:PLP-dependent aminotransferase family protein [Catellatospora sp. KI3]MDI1465955.1 PLP-dependent aminotransferase family protein [Catellatospora sp. KI3]
MGNSNAVDRVIQDLRALAGAAAPGAQLPSVRELTARHQASPVTVAQAIRQLAAEGVVEARPGKGTYAAARPARAQAADLSWQTVALGTAPAGEREMQALLAIPQPGAIALSGGYLEPALQPVAALGAALARAARQPAAWARGPVEGREDLRAWFAREAGAGLRADDMVICPGGQAALSSALRALGSPGDVLLVESPTYLGALAAARAAGLRVVPVPADADGVRPDQLATAFARTGARLFYCQPLYANPHGATLRPDRREAVMDAVRAAGAFLIEDDYARDLAIDGDPPPPLAADDPDGHVVYLRSLTKSAAPGLRVAAIGARGPAGARLRAGRLLDDFYVAGPLQQAAVEFVTAPAWGRHQRALRSALRARRDALLDAVRRHLSTVTPVGVPRGGLHLWVRLPDGTDDVALAARAAAEQVIVFPGRPWYAAEPPAPHLRLTYAAAPPDQLEEGTRRLARTLPA